MSDFTTVLSLIFGFLGGGGALITYMLYRKQLKRFKNAEAVEKEVATLRGAIAAMEQNQKWYEERLSSLQKLLLEKESYVEVLSKDKNLLEIKHSKNKGAINKAYECNFCPDTSKCPVLIQRSKNEDEYLRTLTNTVK